ncbi:hypothetical protein LEMLEM_LOCUS20081 [Lemmus lemmus]
MFNGSNNHCRPVQRAQTGQGQSTGRKSLPATQPEAREDRRRLSAQRIKGARGGHVVGRSRVPAARPGGSQCACAAEGRGGACFRKGSCGGSVRTGSAVLLSALRSVLRASPARGAGEEVWASAGASGRSREAKHLGQNTPDPSSGSGYSGSCQDA